MVVSFRQTAIGRIGMAECSGALTNLWFEHDSLPEGVQAGSSPLLDEAFRQLERWLAGEIESFSLPLAPDGTEFMRRVWLALLDIPYGQTKSYREVAIAAGATGAARAVGTACGRNPLPVFIPCHRVISSDGGLGGYRGGLELKRRFFDMECGQGRR
jgi:methylated-DNA-[protein]-cysteine S-methyltransferase